MRRLPTHPVSLHERRTDHVGYSSPAVRYVYHQSRPTYSVGHTVPPTSGTYREEPYATKTWHKYAEGAPPKNYAPAKFRSEVGDFNRNTWREQPEGAVAENYAPAKFNSEVVDQKRNVPTSAAFISNMQKEPIFVKIHFTAKPLKEDLAQFLRKYRICKFKRIQATNTFAAQLKSLEDFDRICANDDVKCGPHRVNIKPSHKLAARVDKLRSDDEKQRGELKNKTSDKQVEVKKGETTKQQANQATKASFEMKHNVQKNSTMKNTENTIVKKLNEQNKAIVKTEELKVSTKTAAATPNKQQVKVTPSKANEQIPKDASKANITKTPVSANDSVQIQTASKVNLAQQTPKRDDISKPRANLSANQYPKNVENKNATLNKDTLTKTESPASKGPITKSNVSKNEAVKVAPNPAVKQPVNLAVTKNASPIQPAKTENIETDNVKNEDQIGRTAVNAPKIAPPRQVAESKNIATKPQTTPDANKNRSPTNAVTASKNATVTPTSVKETEKVEAKNISQTLADANKNQSPTKAVTAPKIAATIPANVKKTEKDEVKNIPFTKTDANKQQSPNKVATAPKNAAAIPANVKQIEKGEVKNIPQIKTDANKSQSTTKDVTAFKNATASPANVKKTGKNEVKISPQSNTNINVNKKLDPAKADAAPTKTTPNQSNVKKTSNVQLKNIPATTRPDAHKIQRVPQKKPILPKANKISPRKPNKSTIKSTLDKYDDYEELTDQDILALISGGVILDECSGSDDE